MNPGMIPKEADRSFWNTNPSGAQQIAYWEGHSFAAGPVEVSPDELLEYDYIAELGKHNMHLMVVRLI